jgi:hypothetical protein
MHFMEVNGQLDALAVLPPEEVPSVTYSFGEEGRSASLDVVKR